MRFAKGHGTGNDFVVIPPGEHPHDLDPALVRLLCDRRRGIGGDGALRAVERDGDAEWFMDYRNSDGSLAEMCGNGIRVFARYLVAAGHADAGRLRIATRAGVRIVDVPETGDITVDMGAAQPLPDAKVVTGAGRFDAVGWSLGNPHLVALDVSDLAALDLTAAPAVEPADAYPDGVNVEFVADRGDRHVEMRVHERGSGETLSCGTGACAAAVAAMDRRGERTTYRVDVSGGTLQVAWREDGGVSLTGPAVIVATGSVDLAALAP